MWNAEPNWSIEGDIDRVQYRRIDKEIRQNQKFCPDYYVQALNKNRQIDETMKDYLYVTAVKKDGRLINICSNMAIYLLNDDGKTIEKLN